MSFRWLSVRSAVLATSPHVAIAQTGAEPPASVPARNEPPAPPAPNPPPAAAPAPEAAEPSAPAAAPVAAPPSAAPASDETSELEARLALLESEVEQLRVSSAEAETFARRFEIYGFMDMGFQRVWSDSRAASVGTGLRARSRSCSATSTFDATPLPGWRGLTELRFTNYPNGFVTRTGVPALGVVEERTSTSVFDVNLRQRRRLRVRRRLLRRLPRGGGDLHSDWLR